jgi:quercetin dioxygenase-like cupin family protein
MRRFGVLVSVVALMLLGVLALHAQPVAIAQEATPAADEMMPEGFTFEPLTFAFGASVSSPFDMLVARLTLEPGTTLPGDDNDPSVGIVVVESGTLTVQAQGPVTVTRGAGLGEALAAAEQSGDFTTLTEPVAEGEAVTLEAGDAAYLPANTAGELRNDGEEPVVMLGFLVFPSEDMTGQATPAP